MPSSTVATPPARAWLAGLALAVVAAGFAVSYLRLGAPPLIGIDDANITMVYGRNLAAGDGYVYTPGFERVEGSTSPLWTAVTALAFLLADAPEPLLLAVCACLTAWSVYLSFRILAAALPAGGAAARWPIAAHAVFLLGMPKFFTWQLLTLMDTALWTAAVSSLLYALIGGGRPRGPGLALAAVAVVLTRPEGLAVAPGLLVAALAVERMRGAAVRPHLVALAAAAAAAGVAAAVRLWYFGVPLPNTYYVKMSASASERLLAGVDYLADFALNRPLGGVLLVVAAVVLVAALLRLRRDGEPARVAALACLTIGAVAVLPLLSGHDHFYGFRQLQPMHHLLDLPLILRARGAVALPRRVGGRRLPEPALLAVLFALLAAIAHYGYVPGGIGHEIKLAADCRDTGRLLNRAAAPAPPALGIVSAGGLGYTYRGRAYDLLGLNWPAMARAGAWRPVFQGHGSFDRDVFATAPIDLLVPWCDLDARSPAGGGWVNGRFMAIFDGLFADPGFQARFQPVIASDGRRRLRLFARRAWLARYDGALALRPVEWPATR